MRLLSFLFSYFIVRFHNVSFPKRYEWLSCVYVYLRFWIVFTDYRQDVRQLGLRVSTDNGQCQRTKKCPENTSGHKNHQTTMFGHYSHSMALILPSRHFSCIQFSAASRSECHRMTRRRVSLASGTKVGTTSKTFSKLSSVEFSFLSQSARRAAIGGSLAPKTPVLKLNRPVSCKPPAAIVSESARAACTPFAKPQVADLRHRQAK